MRIALVCPYNMMERAGGVGEVVMHLHEKLTEKGHQVRIITPRPTGFKGDAPDDYIFLGTSAKFNAGLSTDGTWTFNIGSDEIKAILDEEKFDVINFHEPWAPILARQILPLSEATHVGTFHANLVDSVAAKSLVNLFIPYGRGLAEKLDLITAVSPAPAAVFLDKDPSHRLVKSIKYIPNGIDIKKYQTRPAMAVKHPKMKTILFIGRLEGRKGVKHLLRAYKDLSVRHKNVRLLIAGGGPDDNKLKEFVEEERIPRVTFLGFISEEDKIRHLHRADVFCSPATHGESFGVVLLEAMAAGCPIVAGDNVGYQSVMKNTGLLSLVNPRDIVDFSRRLEIMIFDQDVRRLWLNWSTEYVKKFDYSLIVEQYENAYKEAMEIHEKRPKAKSRFSLRR
ncbi:glycosyltransferase family 4 protein [Candidatus Saccharibacteria bacterium]|nr:glycosyltransferase family 4 protein [Candidatus Saccharibacteria bacterium]